MAKGYKISDEQFFSVLRESAGLYSRTARAIEKQFQTSYSRQSVKERAEKHQDVLNDIKQENLDIAEEGLQSLMRDKDKRVRLDAIKFYLKGPGKHRDYTERHEKLQIGDEKIIIQFSDDAEKWL